MNDENPYRFAGSAEEEIAHEKPADPSLGFYRRPDVPPILTPGQIRRVGIDRGVFLVGFLVAVGWGFVSAFLADSMPPKLMERIPVDPEIVRDLLWGSSVVLHLFAAAFAFRLQAFADRSLLAAFVLSALLLMPWIQYLVALFLMHDSRETLRRHGIPARFWIVNRRTLPGPDA